MPNQYAVQRAAFDRWMRLALAEQYAETLREPVPEELRRLLAEGDR